MPAPNLSHLTVFAAVARHLSFQRAGQETGLSTSAVSHAIRGLEERLGVTLFNRTTRSVALTEAGQHFLERLAPALHHVDEAVEAMNLFRASPTGTVRINTSLVAAHMVIAPVVARFLAAYPDLCLEIVEDMELIDVVGAGFDAGIRYPDAVPEDMVAVPLGPSCRFAVVATPAWIAAHEPIEHPRDLLAHECVRYRLTHGRIFRWEFEKDGQELMLDVAGRLTVGEQELALRAALDGVGPAFVFEQPALPFLASGRLVRLLEDWCPPLPSFVLYYPRQRQVSSALRAFIDIARDGAG
ncbi:LysR family transcriptional regulator [Bosea sp. BK604]|uniref:LysR family transcriptional regulator n=1 Tax=Bosea sp. BK604 TaxID=2512180 RepID=UPI00104838D1|nr:LysR family transcriptional regulator [Bosea sp. BK604]TCR62970.1 LysR family transcriptional regulator [Bosea sp. BK604]